MAGRSLHKLSDFAAKSVKAPGRHGDGGGLYLYVSPKGTMSWVFMWVRKGKRREMGLGAYPAVSLAKARQKAAECRNAVQDGRDPIGEKAKEAEPTFGECAERYVESIAPEWRNVRHRRQWTQTLTDYCLLIRDKPVSEVGTDDILKILQPIWQAKNETASRLAAGSSECSTSPRSKAGGPERTRRCGEGTCGTSFRSGRNCSGATYRHCLIRKCRRFCEHPGREGDGRKGVGIHSFDCHPDRRIPGSEMV